MGEKEFSSIAQPTLEKNHLETEENDPSEQAGTSASTPEV